MRRGISLLEVLISMFIILIGLLGVASLFPVGSHQAQKGDQFDRAAVLSDEAFANISVRGLLKTSTWYYPALAPQGSYMINSTAVIDPATSNWNVTPLQGPGHVFVIDPLGSVEAPDIYFPSGVSVNPWQTDTPTRPALSGQGWPVRRVTFADAQGKKISAMMAEQLVRLRDELINDPPDDTSRPGAVRWETEPLTGAPIARDRGGNYSWLATVAPTLYAYRDDMQPSSARYGGEVYEVSVAMFFKRDMSQGTVLTAELNQGKLLTLKADTAQELDAGLKGVKPGNWIALIGVSQNKELMTNPTLGVCLLKWYKVLSLDDETNESGSTPFRNATLDGPDWPPEIMPNSNPQQPNYPITAVKAIVLPDVIGVQTQMARLAK